MKILALLLCAWTAGAAGLPWGDDTRLGRPFSKDPSVIRFQGRYLMYYSVPGMTKNSGAQDSWQAGWGVGIAESTNLVDWKKLGEFNAAEPYEGKGVAAPFAMVVDGKVHLFYQSYGNAKRDAICHAVSEDGLRFVRDASNPIFRPSGEWTVGRAIDAEVVRFNGKWFLYAATRDPEMKIQMMTGAVSERGFAREDWKQIGEGPLLKPELPWEQECVEAPSVVVRGKTMYMFYAGAYNNKPQQVGVAKSEDGVKWVRLSKEPWLRNGKPGTWNSSESGHPGAFVDEDGKTYLFYQGNPDMGQTWLLSAVEVRWTKAGPVVGSSDIVKRPKRAQVKTTPSGSK